MGSGQPNTKQTPISPSEMRQLWHCVIPRSFASLRDTERRHRWWTMLSQLRQRGGDCRVAGSSCLTHRRRPDEWWWWQSHPLSSFVVSLVSHLSPILPRQKWVSLSLSFPLSPRHHQPSRNPSVDKERWRASGRETERGEPGRSVPSHGPGGGEATECRQRRGATPRFPSGGTAHGDERGRHISTHRRPRRVFRVPSVAPDAARRWR
mmetsp:Transcript_48918/g.106203  ORF Transcript_48918/g.106203 Transcript_48918/m.106203 type:complete len:207 (-) Transcript_48918:1010-1630(-)